VARDIGDSLSLAIGWGGAALSYSLTLYIKDNASTPKLVRLASKHNKGQNGVFGTGDLPKSPSAVERIFTIQGCRLAATAVVVCRIASIDL
jgi:hypothetical protein